MSILSVYYGPSFEFNIPRAPENAQQLTTLYPNDAVGQHILGWLAMFTGDTKTAIKAGIKTISIDSSYAGTVYDNIGYSLALDCKSDEALQYFLKSLKLRPKYSSINIYLAQLLWLKENYNAVDSSLNAWLPIENPIAKIPIYICIIKGFRFNRKRSNNIS